MSAGSLGADDSESIAQWKPDGAENQGGREAALRPRRPSATPQQGRPAGSRTAGSQEKPNERETIWGDPEPRGSPLPSLKGRARWPDEDPEPDSAGLDVPSHEARLPTAAVGARPS